MAKKKDTNRERLKQLKAAYQRNLAKPKAPPNMDDPFALSHQEAAWNDAWFETYDYEAPLEQLRIEIAPRTEVYLAMNKARGVLSQRIAELVQAQGAEPERQRMNEARAQLDAAVRRCKKLEAEANAHAKRQLRKAQQRDPREFIKQQMAYLCQYLKTVGQLKEVAQAHTIPAELLEMDESKSVGDQVWVPRPKPPTPPNPMPGEGRKAKQQREDWHQWHQQQLAARMWVSAYEELAKALVAIDEQRMYDAFDYVWRAGGASAAGDLAKDRRDLRRLERDHKGHGGKGQKPGSLARGQFARDSLKELVPVEFQKDMPTPLKGALATWQAYWNWTQEEGDRVDFYETYAKWLPTAPGSRWKAFGWEFVAAALKS